ncbi:uncharacterized protein LOC125253186 isoform X2 [Megalobrama amblycephala]|uniref:uncharacterized protein LOC125253186 isoform X2 n=1 Tax=Megalobrama amblycephala TaxID=75352 RepID=UPI00201476E8|nr:uncharacterized protein LOC125253186 isoform X2 [Megalobrama amblycephala]
MKFSCPLICGLVLSCICFKVTSSSSELTVNQSPSNITVNEGDSAQITCCWNETGYRVKVAWYISETKLSGVNEQRQENQTQNCSTLHLTNILKNDTGHYVCVVTQDIPVLVQVEGPGTDLSVNVRQLQKTTVSNPPTMVQVPTRLPAASSSREVVMIYIFRSLPFICLLMAFFYLNRDDKKATVSKPVEHAVESGGQDENLEAGETQRNETEEIKQGEKVSEQDGRNGRNGRDNSEKPEVTAATEEEKNEEKETVVVVEQGSSPVQDNENKSVSVLDTEEKTNLMADVEDVTVSVLGGIVSAL